MKVPKVQEHVNKLRCCTRKEDQSSGSRECFAQATSSEISRLEAKRKKKEKQGENLRLKYKARIESDEKIQ